ncbi:MAG: hypothetical protein JF587_02795 [Catenulisporales bacterium]|nr:hypothetical protein [Catenulisporales bacterium]
MGIADRIFGSARDRFGKKVAARVRALDSVVRTEYDPDNFQVLIYRDQTDASVPVVINLDATFREAAVTSPATRKAAVGRLVDIAALPPTPDAWDGARPLLRPVLRRPVHDPDIKVVSRPALRYLSEMLVLDNPSARKSARKYVGPADLATWGVTAEAAFEAAHRNLARANDHDDGYRTSLPLLEGWLANLRRVAGARPLAFPTSNNVLRLDYESPDPDAITMAVEAAEREWTESAHPISPAPITVDEAGAPVLYELPVGHPAHPAVKHATILLAMSAYGPQTEYLRDVAGPDDPFPASLKGFRSPEGAEFTGTTWTDGVVSLLPHADLVFFQQPGEPMVQIPWDIVAEEAELTPADGFHPARYRVGPWPAPDVMKRMRARAGT